MPKEKSSLMGPEQRAKLTREVSKSPARPTRGRRADPGRTGRQSRIDMLWQNLAKKKNSKGEVEALENSPCGIPKQERENIEGLVKTTCRDSKPEPDPPPGDGL